MANDRIFIRCKECGDMILLAKYYPSFAFFMVHSDGYSSDWLYEHIGAHSYPDDLGNEPGFDLLTEQAVSDLIRSLTPKQQEFLVQHREKAVMDVFEKLPPGDTPTA